MGKRPRIRSERQLRGSRLKNERTNTRISGKRLSVFKLSGRIAIASLQIRFWQRHIERENESIFYRRRRYAGYSSQLNQTGRYIAKRIHEKALSPCVVPAVNGWKKARTPGDSRLLCKIVLFPHCSAPMVSGVRFRDSCPRPRRVFDALCRKGRESLQ